MASIWSKENSKSASNTLKGNISTDVAIIGGGMAGILTAYFLKEENIECAVLEDKYIGSGQTKNTTAKITVQHGLIYNNLIKKFGKEKALQYARANVNAIEDYRRIIRDNNIDCHFESCPAILYTRENPRALITEATAAKQLGIECKLTADTSLPFEVKAALCYPNQAQFNPIEFLNAVSQKVTVFEDTKVLRVSKNRIFTNKGTVNAKNIVFTSHLPFVNFPGIYFARQHQERSYVIALKNAADLKGMYYGIDNDGLSFRSYNGLLLLGGGGHRTGQNDKGDKYTKLRSAAKQFWPESVEVASWSAQDCITPDRIPYIGRFSRIHSNWFVASGFCKWGMTGSMTAARIISNYITNKDNFNAPVFSPSRFNISCVSFLCHEMGKTSKGIAKKLLYTPEENIEDIPAGQGKIVSVNGKKRGVYKNKDGKCYIVSVKCPHLGCQLEWNPDEKSWDCPCHGSRFDYRGRLLDNPAQRGITVKY